MKQEESNSQLEPLHQQHLNNLLKSYTSILAKTKKQPSIRALSKSSGLSVALVKDTLQELSLNDMLADYKLCARELMDILMTQAKNGSIKAIDLYFKLLFEYESRHNKEESKAVLPPIINITSADDSNSFNIQGLN